MPACLEQLTGMSLDTPDLVAAVAAIHPLAATAGLRLPGRVAHLVGSSQSNSRPLFAQLTPSFSGSCSGYSTPSHSHTGTPTAAAAMAAQLQFGMPHNSLLDAVVRQHSGLPRAGSDMSSWSAQTYSDGVSAADLQGLLSASAFAGAAAGSPINPSPLLPGSVSEPLLAAAMAGLQLGMLQQGVPSVPQMPPAWLGSSVGSLDALQGSLYAPQQQQQGSRLQNMTSPYVLPNAFQQAYMMGNAAHLQR
jgi:hypothetical protein